MRRAWSIALCLVVSVAEARAEEPAPEAAAFVELTAIRAEVYAGEPFTLRLRVGFDRAWFEAHAVPLHAQRMDLAVEVEAAGWPALAGATPLADLPTPDDSARPRLRFVLGGEAVEGVARADVVRDGRTFGVLEVEKRLATAEPGTLALPAPTLRFAHATRFTTNALGERVPADRDDAVVHGTPGSVTVRALPMEGRPADFAGAVGRFTLSASVNRSDVQRLHPFRLTLVIEGRGNLATLAPPRLDALRDFHLYGSTDDHGAVRRTVVYELAATRGDVSEIPAIALSFFDPGPPGRYDTARSAPIALSVGPAATDRVTDIGTENVQYSWPAPRVPPWAMALTAGVVLGLLIAWGGRRRRRRRTIASPSLDRRRAALAALRTAAAQPGADLAPAFAEVLAARLDTPAAAAIGPDIAARLTNTGLDPGVAARASATLERLVAARYGGAAADKDLAAEALALGERLSAEPYLGGGT